MVRGRGQRQSIVEEVVHEEPGIVGDQRGQHGDPGSLIEQVNLSLPHPLHEIEVCAPSSHLQHRLREEEDIVRPLKLTYMRPRFTLHVSSGMSRMRQQAESMLPISVASRED